jgi:hypothetical protein
MTHTGKSAGQHNDNNDKDVMGYALPRRENESAQVGLAVRDTPGERPYRDVTLSQVYWTATLASKGKKKGNQSRSVAGFRAFNIERRTEDDVPVHLKGAATWLEI